MKNILNIILLSPILFYVLLLLINNDLLTKKELINIFWITEVELPIISIISIFFVIYIILMHFSWKIIWFFMNHKNNILKKENLKIKSKIADQIPDMNKQVLEKFDNFMNEFKDISNKNLELHKNQTKHVLENIDFEIKNIKTRLDKINIKK
jgi:hypothetical protein